MKPTCTQTICESELSFVCHVSVPQKIMNVSYIKTVACFPQYPVYGLGVNTEGSILSAGQSQTVSKTC
jgi:hypothetical protein